MEAAIKATAHKTSVGEAQTVSYAGRASPTVCKIGILCLACQGTGGGFSVTLMAEGDNFDWMRIVGKRIDGIRADALKDVNDHTRRLLFSEAQTMVVFDGTTLRVLYHKSCGWNDEHSCPSADNVCMFGSWLVGTDIGTKSRREGHRRRKIIFHGDIQHQQYQGFHQKA